MLRLVPVRGEGQTKDVSEPQSPSGSPPRPKADDVRRPRLDRVLVETGISDFVQELEGEVELVVEGHPAHGPRQCGLVRDHLLHASQAVPRLAWWDRVTHCNSAP